MDKGLRQTADGVRLSVLVQPKAKKNEISGWLDGRLKIRLTAPPVEGKANKALIAFLSKFLRIPKSAFKITAGAKDRRKEILIRGTKTADMTTLPRP